MGQKPKCLKIKEFVEYCLRNRIQVTAKSVMETLHISFPLASEISSLTVSARERHYQRQHYTEAPMSEYERFDKVVTKIFARLLGKDVAVRILYSSYEGEPFIEAHGLYLMKLVDFMIPSRHPVVTEAPTIPLLRARGNYLYVKHRGGFYKFNLSKIKQLERSESIKIYPEQMSLFDPLYVMGGSTLKGVRYEAALGLV